MICTQEPTRAFAMNAFCRTNSKSRHGSIILYLRLADAVDCAVRISVPLIEATLPPCRKREENVALQIKILCNTQQSSSAPHSNWYPSPAKLCDVGGRATAMSRSLRFPCCVHRVHFRSNVIESGHGMSWNSQIIYGSECCRP